MRIEKLNENKIRIILSLSDLKEKNIDLHSFMSSSVESQDLFYDMLDKAEKEIGFTTNDYELAIEALAIPEGNFVLTITRFLSKKEKKRNINSESNLFIYMFNTFDNYLEFCNYIQNHLNNNTYAQLTQTSLYQYNSKYYLCINNISLDSFKFIYYSIVEFATHITNSDFFERKLIEYGKVIFKTNAINECIKAF